MLFCREFENVVNRAFLVLIFWGGKLVGANFYAFCNYGLYCYSYHYCYYCNSSNSTTNITITIVTIVQMHVVSASVSGTKLVHQEKIATTLSLVMVSSSRKYPRPII